MQIKDVAKVLGIKVRTIREWIRAGRLQAHKEGRLWIIPEEEVYRKETQERANKGREHSRRIKEGIELGMLARGSENPEKSV